MITRRAVIGLATGGLAMLMVGCVRYYPTYRYRLTVEVDTPSGVKFGSSVIQVRSWDQAGFPGPEAGGFRSEVKGEAVAVDVAPGQTLFALLRSEHSVDWATFATAEINRDDRAVHTLPRWKKNPGTGETYSRYPMLVRFRDIHDPKSVELVDPDDLAATFGPGFKLRRIAVQLTRDPVTVGIKSHLPSMGKGSGFDYWYRSLPPGDQRHISLNDFTKGE
ncbi:MAG: hypothetical protein WC816_08170 [Sphingomonas sp.]|jgi:hypothetical protein